jgi:hypothetical protein
LEDRIFEKCLEKWKNSDSHTPFWGELAKELGYPNGEYLRSEFKNERKRNGIHKSDFEQSENRVTYNSPRVAVIDIETLPGIGYFWSLWDQNIGIEQIVSDICVLGWAGKFLNESEMYSDVLTPKEAKNRDDKRIAQSCWDFLSRCDVVIGHNYQSFDAKHINTAFLKHNIPPLKYTIVDTLLVAKQNFHFTSNKLAFINQKLGMRDKISHEGFVLWKDCSDGKEEALKEMRTYNEGDIYSTEELFYKIRPYVRNFNVALYNEIDELQCPVCGSTNLNVEGMYYTSAGKWESARCQDCKCISRKKQNLLSKDKKKSLLVNS